MSRGVDTVPSAGNSSKAPVTQPASPSPRRRKAPKQRGGRFAAPLYWAVPGVALTLAVHFISVGIGAGYAFTDWNGVSAQANWVGLQNFEEIFGDPQARGAVIYTIVLALAAVVLSNIIGLALALGLNRTLKSRNVMRAIFFAPVVLSPLAISYIWQYIFDAFGPLNSFLDAIGLGEYTQAWLADPVTARWTILVVLTWQYSGLAMAFYLAGLQGVPEEIEEAASVDGASTVRRVWSIILPLLAPAVTASVTITTVFSLRVFDQVVALTGGGPAGATETLATQIYTQTFVAGRFGYGAALALVLTVLVAIVSVLQLVILRAREKRI